MKIRSLFVLGIFMILAAAAPAPAQNQSDTDAARRDVFVMLDISGSMNEGNKFSRVKEYIAEEVFDGILKAGDSFTLITFGDTASEKLSRTLASEADKAELRAALETLKADDNYTDIGTAMETLAALLERRQAPGVRQIILFITDGKNTPPRRSSYYGKDLAIDDNFRSIGEKISKGGWFLYVIGIGGETDAKNIADAVPGSVYTRTDDKLSDVSGEAMRSYVDKVDAEAHAREAEQKRAEEEKAAALVAAEAERGRTEEES
ncbi:MAG: VWA domain-containing protein, partial [Spirochaetales bacterium]|nr:VWA domain-containing protein [Spirochaetales bacterium]